MDPRTSSAEAPTSRAVHARRTACTVVVLTGLAIAVRAPGLAPSSLFLDDAWVGYVSKVGYGDIGMMGLTSPGFIAIQKVWFDLVGFSEMRAQAVPFFASIASPGLAFALFRRVVRAELAVSAGVIVAFTSLNVKYSFHIKQYTLEVLAGLLIVLLCSRWMRQPTQRRLWSLIGFTIVSTLISFLTVVLATGPIALITLRMLRLRGRELAGTATALVAWALITLSWFFVVVAPNTSDTLQAFWSDFYVETGGSALDLTASLRDRVWDLFESLTPFPPAAVAVVMTVTFAATIRRHPDWAIIASVPLIAAAVLAAMERAPLGGGRTDNYLLVPLLTGFIVGVDAIVDLLSERWARRRPHTEVRWISVGLAALVSGLSIGAYEEPQPYPQEDIRPLIDELTSLRQPDDVVLLYYASTFAYALYADVESEPIDTGWFYGVEFDDPNLIVQGSHRSDTSLYAQYAQAALAQSDRIWLLASHPCACDWGEINRQLTRDFGLKVAMVSERPGASLQLLVASS